MKVVIVDDEKHFQDSLSQLLAAHFPEVEILEIANSLESGREAIERHLPDLVFLDVELGNNTGFDLLDELKKRKFQVVFVTAHNHYAVNAFRYSAIDFLLKPIVSDQLIEAVNRAKSNLDTNHLESQLKVLASSLSEKTEPNRKIVLKGLESFHVVNLSEILWCSAEGSYTSFHLANGQNVVVSNHLKEYEKLLASSRFFRVHRSYLVNLDHVTKYDRSEGVLFFTGDFPLPVSLKRERMEELIEKL